MVREATLGPSSWGVAPSPGALSPLEALLAAPAWPGLSSAAPIDRSLSCSFLPGTGSGARLTWLSVYTSALTSVLVQGRGASEC